jgi:flagellar biosynthesis/type III secretory pathway M-ring protein FliF/YscJ
MDRRRVTPATLIALVAALAATGLLFAAQFVAAPQAPSALAPSLVAATSAGAADPAQGRLQALIDTALGPGRGAVIVNAQLNADQVTRAQQAYARTGTPLAASTDRLTTPNGSAGSSTTDWGVGQTITQTRVAPGATRRQDVALVIDRTVPAATVTALRSTIATAAGINRARGDRLSVARVTMAARPAQKGNGILAVLAAPTARTAIGYARWVALGIAGLIVVAALARALKRAEEDVLIAPEEMRRDAPQA